MTNYQPELEDYLVAGKDYDYFSDLDELKEKCRFYLKNEDIRKNIAISGYKKAKNYHSYTNRMPEFFKRIL